MLSFFKKKKDPFSGGDVIIPLGEGKLSGWGPSEVKPPDQIPEVRFERDDNGQIDKETADKILQVFELHKEKMDGLEATADEFKKTAEELNSAKEQVVQIAAQAKVMLGDGDKEPEWLTKVQEGEPYKQLRGQIDGMVHVLKNFKKTHSDRHISGLDDSDSEKDKEKLKKFNLIRYALGIQTGNWKDAGFEHEVAVELARRRGFEGEASDIQSIRHAVTRGTDATGGYMFPESVMDMLIAEIVPASLPGAVGVSVINDIPRDRKLLFPVLTARDVGGWVGEAGSISAGTATFAQRELAPSKYAGRILVSNEALESITPGQNAVLMQALREEIMEGVSQGFMTGTGSSNQPQGVIGDDSIPATHKLDTAGANGADLAGLNDFKRLLKLLTKTNTLGLPSNMWLMHQALETELSFWPIANYSGQELAR